MSKNRVLRIQGSGYRDEVSAGFRIRCGLMAWGLCITAALWLAPDAGAQTQPAPSPNLNSVRYASGFQGADACAKIQAALDDLPSTGGRIVADFEGEQSCAGGFALTKPVEIDFGAATYHVGATINLTGLHAKGAVLRGIRKSEAGISIFKGETGGVLFDLSGSANIKLQDFTVLDGDTNKSTVAFLLSRTTDYHYCNYNELRSIYVKMATNPTANGGYGSVGIYNNAGEAFTLDTPFIIADNPLVLTGSNAFGIETALATHYTGTTSHTLQVIRGPATFVVAANGLGYPVYLQGVEDVVAHDVYTAAWTGHAKDFAFYMKNVWALTLTGHTEYSSRVIELHGDLRDGKIIITANNQSATDSQIYLAERNTRIKYMDIDIWPKSGPGGDLFQAFDDSVRVYYSRIFLHEDDKQALGIPGSYMVDDFIYSSHGLAAYHRLGINTTSPAYDFDMYPQADSGAATQAIRGFSDSAYPYILFSRARNSASSPTGLESGDTIAALMGKSRNSSEWNTTASPRIAFLASEDQTANAQGNEIVFSTTANGTTARLDRLTIGNNGVVTVQKATVSGLNSVAFSAAPDFDAALGNTQKIVLTDDVTSSTLSNAAAGQTFNFLICQDGRGHHAFAWPANVRGAMTVGPAGSTCSAQSFIFDGTNAYATGPGVAGMPAK
jgi:hypothetical protein